MSESRERSEHPAVAAKRYPAEVKDLALACFMEADRNCAETHRKLRDLAKLDPDLTDVPSVQTIRYWVRSEAWEAKIDALVAENFPHIRQRHLARLIVGGAEGLGTLIRIARGDFLEHRSPGQVASMATAAAKLADLAGLGTAGMRTEGVKVAPLPAVGELPEGMTPLQQAEWLRERLEQARRR